GADLPHLGKDTAGNLFAVANGTVARFFDAGNSPRFFLQDTLVENGPAKEFALTDTAGNVLRFNNFDQTLLANQRGQFKSFTDTNANVTSVTAYATDGKPQEIQRSVTVGGTTTIESILLTYGTTGGANGRITNATLRRQVGGGSWTTVRQVDLSYYGSADSQGTLGDLQKAILKDGTGNALDTSYYRYYVDSTSGGYAGGPKYVFNAESYARLLAVYSDPTTATDAQVAPSADNFFQYDVVYRAVTATVQGQGCSACSGGLGTFTATYTTSIFADAYNNWRTKTVTTRPDGNQQITYTNEFGEVMLDIFKDT